MTQVPQKVSLQQTSYLILFNVVFKGLFDEFSSWIALPQPPLHLPFLSVSLHGWSPHLLRGNMAHYCMHTNVCCGST